jgi:heme-degrading monooxygenase HmoA
MAAKVIITRTFKPGTISKAHQLLMEFRSLATLQPGYISGETLVSAQNPDKIVVISAWRTLKKWEEWSESDKRKSFLAKLNEFLREPEMFETYYVGEKIGEWVDMA